ncbi:fluoride efflux transporter CrcB [Pelagibacterales bacterium SAG-MED31]|nr:fluoride efflux transporter CrcB [Pelagibacterales bacterium SAG-MED31]
MINLLLVTIGGSIGASTRFFTYLFFKNYLFTNYLFLSTLFVNIIGSFFIGFLIMLMESKNMSSDFIKYFLIIGVLGSFTTFSSFSLESIDLLLSKKFLLAFSYIILSLSLCLIFTFIGLNINKLIN